MSEDWMKSALELLFTLSRDPVLIVGSATSCVDAALIACLRRIQRWGLCSVLANFRQLTGRKIFDLEQFIEFFDASIVHIPPHRTPAYLDMFLKVEVKWIDIVRYVLILLHVCLFGPRHLRMFMPSCMRCVPFLLCSEF
jgi:hypothetical protein